MSLEVTSPRHHDHDVAVRGHLPVVAAPPHGRARALAPLHARRALRGGVGLDGATHAAYEGDQAGAE